MRCPIPIASLLLLLFFSVAPGVLSAQNAVWEPASGPFGGTDVFGFAAHPDGMYFAATAGGVFRSDDKGQSWSQVDTGFEVSEVVAVQFDANGLLWAATRGSGLYRSFDQGLNWSSAGLRETPLTAFTLADGLYLAGSEEGDLFRSIDGIRWVELPYTFASGLTALAISKDGIALAGTEDGLFRSVDQGLSWAPPGTASSALPIGVIEMNADGFFAGTEDGRLLFSEDGLLWENRFTFANPLPIRALYTAPNGSLLAGTQGGLIELSAAGDLRNAYLFGHELVEAVMQGPDALLLAGVRTGGIYRSENGGSTWSVANEGLTAIITALALDDDGTLYTGTPGGVFRSEDEGETWTDLSDRETAFGITSMTVVDGHVFAATTTGTVLRREEDRWAKTGTLPPPVNGLLRGDSLEVLAATANGLFRLPPDGSGWLNTGLSGFPIHAVDNGGRGLLFAAITGRLMHSPDGGTSWFPTRLVGEVQAIAVAPDSTVFVALEDGSIHRTADTGSFSSAWESIGDGLPVSNIQAFAFDGPTIYAGTRGTGLFRSTDGGATWRTFNEGLGHRYIQDFALGADGTLYVGTRGGGIYRNRARLTGLAPADVPTEITLAPNYPNPFNPVTTLHFSLPRPSTVRLTVFDVLGRAVATVAEGPYAAGTHRVAFDASGLPGGIYLYRLQAGGVSRSRVMTLVK